MLAPRYSPWNRIVCFVLGSGLITSAFYAVIFLALSMTRSLAPQGVAVDPNGLERAELGITVLSYPPLLGWIVYCRHFLDRRSVRSLGLRLDRAGRSLLAGALAGALAIAWLFGAMWLCGALVYGGPSPEAFERTPPQIALSLGAFALLFAAVAFMEEISFRGYLLHNLSASLKLRRAIWVQAILFALVHLPNAAGQAQDANVGSAAWADAARALPSLALIGAILALMWAKTGSLWPSVGFHFAWNFCLGCVFSLPVSGLSTFRLFDFQAVGSPWISGGSFGAEGSVLLWPILLGAWWMLNRMPDHPQAARDLSLLDPRHPATLSEAQMAQMQAQAQAAPPEEVQQPRLSPLSTTEPAPAEAERAEPWASTAPSSPFAPSGAEAKIETAQAPSPTIFSPLPFERARPQAHDAEAATAPQVLAAPEEAAPPFADGNAEATHPTRPAM